MNIIDLIEQRNQTEEIRNLIYSFYKEKYYLIVNLFETDKIYPNIISTLQSLSSENLPNPVLFYGIKHGIFHVSDVPKENYSIPMLNALDINGLLDQVPLSACLYQPLEDRSYETLKNFISDVDGFVEKIKKEWTSLTVSEKNFLLDYKNSRYCNVGFAHFLNSMEDPLLIEQVKSALKMYTPDDFMTYFQTLSPDIQSDMCRILPRENFYKYAAFDIRQNPSDIDVTMLSEDMDNFYANEDAVSIKGISLLLENNKYSLKRLFNHVINLYVNGFLSYHVVDALTNTKFDDSKALTAILDDLIDTYGFNHKKFSYQKIISHFMMKSESDKMLLGFDTLKQDILDFEHLPFTQQCDMISSSIEELTLI